MIDNHLNSGDTRAIDRQPIGVWVSAVANIVGIAAGAVFLFAPAGTRFRGMEPQAQLFVVLVLLAAALGLFAGLPTSLYDVFWQRRRLWGALGALLALTPWPVAVLMSELVADLKGIFFD